MAQTIQGEAGANPAAQFAVASTIYNRVQAGTFPGGSSAYGVVNAPSQYVAGAGQQPNATAIQFANAIENGTLGQYGTVGNAVNFQTAGSPTTLGSNSPGVVNIGGNNFSDNFGSPTSNFQAPVYGGTGSGVGGNATSDTSYGGTVSTGVDPVTGQPDWVLPDVGVTGDVTGQSPTGTASGTGASVPGLTSGATGVGNVNLNFGQQATTLLGQLVQAPITAMEGAVSGWLGTVENWFGRGFVIILGIAVIVVGLWMAAGRPNPAVIMEAAA